MSFPLYVLVSAVGGLVVGVLGTGSSLILLPSLILIFGSSLPAGSSLRLAAGTTMATMAVGAISGAIARYRAGHVDTRLFRLTIGPYVIGALVGAWVSRTLPTQILGVYVAAIILLVAARMLFSSRSVNPAHRTYQAHRIQVRIVLTAIAIASSIAGIASGIFSIPYLLRFCVPVRTVIGTATTSAAVFASFGTIGYLAAGWSETDVPPGSFGFIYLPAFAIMATVATITTPIGVRLAGRLREDVVRRLFALFLVGAAIAVAFTL